MALVKRENRVLTVHDDIVHTYLIEGYDQIDSEGSIVKRATGGRNVSLVEYNKLLDELDKLRDKDKIEELEQVIKDKNEEIKILEADNDRLTKQVKGQTNNSGSGSRR